MLYFAPEYNQILTHQNPVFEFITIYIHLLWRREAPYRVYSEYIYFPFTKVRFFQPHTAYHAHYHFSILVYILTTWAELQQQLQQQQQKQQQQQQKVEGYFKSIGSSFKSREFLVVSTMWANWNHKTASFLVSTQFFKSFFWSSVDVCFMRHVMTLESQLLVLILV